MIKHHPKFELLQSYVAGDLPASLAAAISVHAGMCRSCQQQIEQLTQTVAQSSFEQDAIPNALADLDMEAMIQTITASNEQVTISQAEAKLICFKGESYQLPTALRHIPLGKTTNIGKLARARLQLDEAEIHTSLLHIEPGGSVPEHTHNGFELTLLLDGSFNDENGEYVAGDFILLNHSDKHHPISEKGCLCYTVVNDSLHFTQGINKLLNPIGAFIY